MLLRARLFLGAALLLVTTYGCGEGDQKAKSVPHFFSQNKAFLREHYHQLSESGKYRWVLQVHFRGNDFFGALAGEELATNLGEHLRSKENPLSTSVLAPDEAALEIRFAYKKPQILGSLGYRAFSSDRAIRAMKHLFNCESGKPNRFSEVFLIGSGGSHGADELQKFNKKLQKACGKSVDAVVVGDGIKQPLSFPLNELKGIPKSISCLNFFQLNPLQLIRGQSLKNCFNVQIEKPNALHKTLQESLCLLRGFSLR